MGFQFDRRPKDLEKLCAAGSLVGTMAWGLTPPHPRGTGLGWGPRVRVALAHFPGEITKVLLFVPFFFFFSFPSHIRVLFVKQEKEDTTTQEITALHLSKSFKNIQQVTFPQLYTIIVGTVDA